MRLFLACSPTCPLVKMKKITGRSQYDWVRIRVTTERVVVVRFDLKKWVRKGKRVSSRTINRVST